MSNSRCSTCQGAGKIMGGGMIFKDCEVCDGSGKSVMRAAPKVDKKSRAFKDAVKRIRKADSKLSQADAEKYLESEL